MDKTISEKYRENELWELAGLSEDECPMPYPELDHAHIWGTDDYCVICGADGRA